MFSLISEYVYNRKYDRYGVPNSGIFADGDIYDNTAQRANGIMANVMVNNIWPNGIEHFLWEELGTHPIRKKLKIIFLM
ncbi:MAG: hypothetical protein L6V95_09920 [Candidatus Melainabacteria bacterium]|nr:MAG: hypothetical protein L6V95_09920 [Candidatus Melainabacteria bacterium]